MAALTSLFCGLNLIQAVLGTENHDIELLMPLRSKLTARAPIEPTCDVFFSHSLYVTEDEDFFNQHFVVKLVLDESWAPVCGRGLELAFQTGCPDLDLWFAEEPRIDPTGNCHYLFKLGARGKPWNLDPENVNALMYSCVKTTFRCLEWTFGLKAPTMVSYQTPDSKFWPRDC